ncbi:MAG: LytTR family DNA-binding domain-containing protein [Defluviitaleaceae bacterium]|nr:LytTR family DNA-binding domain-containing protein [Defluviitaleaceae bacterium]
MFSIGICDDEAIEVKFLTKLIHEWAETQDIIVYITSYANAEAFLMSSNVIPDILLLDIQMGKMDGMALAKHIRQSNAHVQFIFITGFTDYMSQGYEVDALHYLIKPIKEEQLFAMLTKAVERLSKEDDFLLVQTREDNMRLRHKDIFYIEAFAHYILIVLENKTIETRAKISEIENLLNDGFVRCHRSYIVGLRHINRIGKTEIILDNGQSIPLSRRLYNEVNQTFIKFHMRA